ncbi:MAG: HvfA family oxazolone/thioamide-modified RiPP metallophore [Gammaproteobacteria bacterium]
MSKKSTMKPLAAAIGSAVVASLAAVSYVQADQNPFGMSTLSSGYMVADHHKEGICGEGKCGEDKKGEGKCGEGKCGEGKSGESM